MTRKKKTRTEKSIGAAKKPLLKQADRIKDNSKKKGKGRPSGAKANLDGVSTNKLKTFKKNKSTVTDNRIGSKKTIELIPQPIDKDLAPKVVVKKRNPEQCLSIEQQLAQVENDVRLNKLLDALDDGVEISTKDHAYIEHQTAKHQKLMAQIEDKSEQQESPETWEQLDSSEFDEFKS